MREQSGFYERPPQVPGVRRRPQNIVKPHSPRKDAPPEHGPKTPAQVKGAKGSPGAVAGQKGAKISAQEAKVRGKVRAP